MVNNGENKLIRKRPGVISFSFSGVTFMILCVYLAMVSLCYVEWMPFNLVSLSLYGFVAMTALALCVKGRVTLEIHTIWYAVVLVICMISRMYSVNSAASSTVVSEMVKILLFSVMFLNTVDSTKRIRTAMWTVSLSVVFLFLYLSYTGQLEVEGRLGQDLTGNANTFASIFMIGAFCSVYFVYFSEKKVRRVLALIVFLMQLYAIALAGSRKFFLMPVALLGLLKMFSGGATKRKFLFRNVIITAAVLLITWWALFNVDFLYEAIGYRMEGMVAAITGEGEADASAEIRMDMIERGIELWRKSPLLGHGINSYKVLSGYRTYSHNNYTELLCGIGVVGLFIYYSYTVVLSKKLVRSEQMGLQRWYWVIALGCLLIFDYGAVTYYMYPVHIIMLLANCALRTENESKRPARKETVDCE